MIRVAALLSPIAAPSGSLRETDETAAASFMWKLSAMDLVRIAEGASTPAERLDDRFHKNVDAASAAQATALWTEWARHISKGDAVVMAKVLGWRGMDMSVCRESLLPVKLADPSELPDWVVDLDRLVSEAANCLPGPTQPACRRTIPCRTRPS